MPDYNFDSDPYYVAEKKRWLQLEKECGYGIGVNCDPDATDEEIERAIAYNAWIHNGK